VLGRPIAHSLSPVLHRAAYRELGLDWTYDAVEVGSDALAEFVGSLGSEWRGLSLTMPLKRAVLPMLDAMDAWAELSGAANTVVFEDGRLHGANTDVPGAVAAIRERSSAPLRSAVVLGGGATATSVLLALAELGLERATLLVRSPSRAEETVAAVARHRSAPRVAVARLGGPRRPEADIVVSTIPADAQEPSLVAALAAVPVVFEVVYDHWPTPLAAAALGSGRELVSGLDLLVHQAALQVELMTGLDAPLEAMRSAGEAALQARVEAT
jgi:shikimate dehydrogenase